MASATDSYLALSTSTFRFSSIGSPCHVSWAEENKRLGDWLHAFVPCWEQSIDRTHRCDWYSPLQIQIHGSRYRHIRRNLKGYRLTSQYYGYTTAMFFSAIVEKYLLRAIAIILYGFSQFDNSGIDKVFPISLNIVFLWFCLIRWVLESDSLFPLI